VLESNVTNRKVRPSMGHHDGVYAIKSPAIDHRYRARNRFFSGLKQAPNTPNKLTSQLI
jgi:hypothetical protein